MSLRDYSVIVSPEDWSGPVEDLARRLVPIVGQPSSQLVKRFTNGPMTVESDLTLQSAQALSDRLETLGVTSRIQSEKEEEAIDVDDFEWDATDFDLDAMFSEVENLPGDSSAVFDQEVDPRQTQMGFSTAFADDIVRSTAAPEPRQPAGTPSGWGEIFPELQPTTDPQKPAIETATPEVEPSVPEQTKQPPSLDELIGGSPKQLDSSVKSKTPPKKPIELARIEPVKRLVEVPKGPAAPKPDASPARSEPVQATPTPKPKKAAPQNPSMSAAAFMNEIVGGDVREDVGPYAPAGFDDGYEHASEIATALALLAPGAGHVYNGADEKAISIALKSFMIKPWIDSVGEAREHAEKIQNYHRPRPEKGSFRRALIHLGIFWFALILLIASATFVLTRYVFHESEAETFRKVTTVDISDAHANARMKVIGSRLKALQALKEELQKQVTPTFSMSEEERVRRLYAAGVERCRNKDYGACTAIMKRVVKLDPLYRSALTLQTWSSEQLSAKVKKPMPEIGDVPTLSELEKSELLEEVPDMPAP